MLKYLRKYNEQNNNNTANMFRTSSLQRFGRQVAEQVRYNGSVYCQLWAIHAFNVLKCEILFNMIVSAIALGY